MKEHATKISHALNVVNEIIDQYPDANYDESIEEFLDMMCSARDELQNALDFVEE